MRRARAERVQSEFCPAGELNRKSLMVAVVQHFDRQTVPLLRELREDDDGHRKHSPVT
jgi:hypothetical protein